MDTKLKIFIDGEELKVKEFTITDEIEDLLLKDLIDLGYQGEELKTKVIKRKEAINKAFDRLLEERLKEETVPLDEAIKGIKDGI